MLENVKTWYWTGSTKISSVMVGQVDGAGGFEIVTAGTYNDGYRDVAQLCVWDGATLSLKNVKTWYWTSSTIINSVADGNVDGDSEMEIVTGGLYYDGSRFVAQLCIWNGATLTLEDVKTWYWTANTVINSVITGNIDSDNSEEIITGGYYFNTVITSAQMTVWG